MDWSHVLAGVVVGAIGSLLTIIAEPLLCEPRAARDMVRAAATPPTPVAPVAQVVDQVGGGSGTATV